VSEPLNKMNNYTIITYLKDNRGQELPLEEVEKGTGIKISSSPQLLQNLKENPSINYSEDVSSGTAKCTAVPFTTKISCPARSNSSFFASVHVMEQARRW
jgi:hypothetical protein